MSYTVLARKYRPQDFESLVGQLPVSKTLLNALESGRIAHAYVFSGPRGVGKTTTARILAKCLNCEKGTSIKPCNECASCIEIGLGVSMQDVLEIDGASNRGIEQIRELRESAKYAPTKCRYRIFIIDEAHQITKDAFGALLKTLEEPPSHVIFMMATTEVQKIPAPILSRCQRFSLRPISPEIALGHLKTICQKEKVKVEDSALADIVKFTEGSLRDALSLLDQALVFSPEGITSRTLRDLLGLLPEELVKNFAHVIQTGDPVGILKSINTLIQEGVDFTQLAKDLQSFYHTLLLEKAGVEDPLSLNQKNLAQVAAAYEFPTLERLIRLLSRASDEMRTSDAPRAVFEIYALQMGQKTLDPRTLVDRLEKLETSKLFPSPVAERPTPRYNPVTISTPIPAVISTPSTPLAPLSKETIEAGWKDILNEIAQSKQGLSAALEEATPHLSEKNMTLTFNKAFSHQLVQRNLETITPLIVRTFGPSFSLHLKLQPSDPKSAPSAAAKTIPVEPVRPSIPPEEASSMEELPPQEAGAEIQMALKHFPGTLKREKKT